LSHLLFLPRYYVGFGRFTLYLKDEHMAHFFEIVFLHHYMDITSLQRNRPSSTKEDYTRTIQQK
jgi:hypothetical protein